MFHHPTNVQRNVHIKVPLGILTPHASTTFLIATEDRRQRDCGVAYGTSYLSSLSPLKVGLRCKPRKLT